MDTKKEIYIDTVSGEVLAKHTYYPDKSDKGRRWEYYYSGKKVHRRDGPAIMVYENSSKVMEEWYYFNDIEITDPLQLLVLETLSAERK